MPSISQAKFPLSSQTTQSPSNLLPFTDEETEAPGEEVSEGAGAWHGEGNALSSNAPGV